MASGNTTAGNTDDDDDDEKMLHRMRRIWKTDGVLLPKSAATCSHRERHVRLKPAGQRP